MSSDEENSLKDITLERVIRECGAFGPYQYINAFFLLLFPIATGVYGFYYVFAASEAPYQCHVSNNINRTLQVEISPSQCSYELKNNQNKTIGIYPCTEWIYNRSVYGKTFTEEANFICEHSVYRSFLATALQIGAMFIFFTGRIIDVIGRRRALILLIGQLLVISLITQGLLQFVPMTKNEK